MATMPCAEASNPSLNDQLLYPKGTAGRGQPGKQSKKWTKNHSRRPAIRRRSSRLSYFDLAFMVWVLLGPLGIGIAKDLGLPDAERA